jgi:hypothetical protein
VESILIKTNHVPPGKSRGIFVGQAFLDGIGIWRAAINGDVCQAERQGWKNQ